MLAIKGPTTAAEADYMHSVVSATSMIRNRLYLFTPVANRRSAPGRVLVTPFPAQS